MNIITASHVRFHFLLLSGGLCGFLLTSTYVTQVIVSTIDLDLSVTCLIQDCLIC